MTPTANRPDGKHRDTTGAYLSGADLSGVTPTDTNLYGANLAGADLSREWRDPDDPPIPGWTVTNGRLTKEVTS